MRLIRKRGRRGKVVSIETGEEIRPPRPESLEDKLDKLIEQLAEVKDRARDWRPDDSA